MHKSAKTTKKINKIHKKIESAEHICYNVTITELKSGVNYFEKVGSELLKKSFLMMQFSDITLVYRHKGLRKPRLLKICIQS